MFIVVQNFFLILTNPEAVVTEMKKNMYEQYKLQTRKHINKKYHQFEVW